MWSTLFFTCSYNNQIYTKHVFILVLKIGLIDLEF